MSLFSGIRDIVTRVRVVFDSSSANAARDKIKRALGQATDTTVPVQNMKKLDAQVDKTTTRVVQFGKKAKQANREAGDGATALTGLYRNLGSMVVRAGTLLATYFGGRAMIQFVRGSVEAFASFDQAVTSGIAIAGEMGQALRTQIEDKIKSLGIEWNVQFESIAKGFEHLISAGYNAAGALKALEPVTVFAKAGLMEVVEAVDYLSDSAHALGLISKDPIEQMKNLERVSNALTKANIMSNATIRDFAEALTNKAGASLRVFNKDVEEGMAVLAAMASQGTKASVAGERFDIFLRELTRTAVKNKETFKEWGIEVFDGEGKVNNLADVVEDLSVALLGLNDEQQVAALMQLGFTFRSVQALKQLLGLQDAIREYEHGIRSAGNATQEVADNRMKNIKDRWGQFTNSVRAARIELGEQLVPALNAGMDALGGDKGVVALIDALTKDIKENQEVYSEFARSMTEVAIALAKLAALSGKVFVYTMDFILNPIETIRREGRQAEIDRASRDRGWRNMNEGHEAARNARTAFWIGLDGQMPKTMSQMQDEAAGNVPGAPAKPKKDRTIANPESPEEKEARERRKALEDDLQAELARIRDTGLERDMQRIKELEDRYREAYNGIPKAAKAAFAELRAAAAHQDRLAMHRRELEFMKQGDPSDPAAQDEVEEFIATLVKERETTEVGSKARADYNKLLQDTADLYDKIIEARNKDDEDRREKDRAQLDAIRDSLRDIEDIGLNAAYNLMDAFGEFFSVLFEDANNAGQAFEGLARGMGASLLAGIGDYAQKKVAMNIADAIESVAHGLKAASNPLTAAQAPGYFAAAKTFALSAAKWAVLGGAASGGISALMNKQESGRGTSDTGGKITEDSSRIGPSINIYLDGVDPKNPRHQKLIGETVREYSDRGGTLMVHT